MSIFDVVKGLEEKLTFKKKAVVCGITFELALLNYEQDQMINAFPDEGDNPLMYYEKTRSQVLSYALLSIDGEVIPEIVQVQESTVLESMEKAIYVRKILKKMPPSIVEKLFEIYIDFKEETELKLVSEIEYLWYKTPEQRLADAEKKKEEDKSNKGTAEDSEAVPGEQDDSESPLDEKPIEFKKIEEKDDEVSQAE